MAESYEIRIKGVVDERWFSWCDSVTIAHTTNGVTVLQGTLPDQSTLHGLLAQVASLGLSLLLVTRCEGRPRQEEQPELGTVCSRE